MKRTVYKPTGRKFFYMQYIDPKTGKTKTKTTKKTNKRDAERFASDYIANLGKKKREIERITWEDFRIRYERDAFLGLAQKSINKNKTTLNKIKAILDPEFLDSVNDEAVEKLRSELYSQKLEPHTIKTHLVLTKKALKWAESKGLIQKIPAIEFPKHITEQRGRPITQEEFDRILNKAEVVVGPSCADSWKYLLKGIWWGGLRIGEAMSLHWTDDTKIMIDTSGEYPMFLIPDHIDKARKDRILPMAPEFAELLSDQEREGFVFNPLRRIKPFEFRMSVDYVGKVISRIGEKANVKVSEIKGCPKYASAHDYRRAFGARWAKLVKEFELMELMRHESIETTRKFYAKENAQETAKSIWKMRPNKTNTLTNTSKTKPTRRKKC